MTPSLYINPDIAGDEEQGARPLHPGGGANQLRVRAYNERLGLGANRFRDHACAGKGWIA